MASTKRRKHATSRGAGQPGQPLPRTTIVSALAEPQAPGEPIGEQAAPPVSPSPAAERAAFRRRRAGIFAGALLVPAALIAYGVWATRSPAAPAAPTAPAATVAAERTAPPAPSAAPAPQIAAGAIATPAAAAVAATPAAAPAACAEIAGLPIYDGATCTKQDSDQEDGATKRENTYVAAASADQIRQFFEAAFAQRGWALGEFKYDLAQGQRRAQIKVELDQGASGSFTKVRLTEHGGPAPAGATCAPIEGLPALPDAACIQFDADQDDGVRKIESTYSTSAPPDQVWRLYASALAQGRWSGQEFQYSVQQGASTLEIKVQAQPLAQAAQTEFKIAEK